MHGCGVHPVPDTFEAPLAPSVVIEGQPMDAEEYDRDARFPGGA